jgi:uncharacterized protein (DUF427 family)
MAASPGNKGTAEYWAVSIDGGQYDDIVWGYRTPLPESAGIRRLVSFYNEKVGIRVGGVPEDRPKTIFS